MEEVTPPDLYRLIEFGDGAVLCDDLIKIVRIQKFAKEYHIVFAYKVTDFIRTQSFLNGIHPPPYKRTGEKQEGDQFWGRTGRATLFGVF